MTTDDYQSDHDTDWHPMESLLNRRRRNDLARIVGPRTLDAENICTRCGVPDVHCWCSDANERQWQADDVAPSYEEET
jgi:hypothetical protein